MTPHELTPEEQALADEFIAAEKVHDELDNKLYELFMKGVQPLLDAGDFEGARGYAIYMPNCVGRMFVMDAIRNARGDFKK